MSKHAVFFTLIVFAFLSYEAKGQSHPYLLFNQSDLPAIRIRAHTQGTPELPPWAIWNRLILNKQANYFLTEDGGRDLLNPTNWIENNIASLALAYLIEQNPVYLTQVRKLLWDGYTTQPPIVGMLFQPPCVDNNYWNKAHQVIGLSLVYDLLYNEFSDQERVDIKTAIRAKIFDCDLRAYDYSHWADYGNNQWALRASAMGLAALALYGDPIYSEAATDLNHVRTKMLTAPNSLMKRYFHDGASVEGIYYGLATLTSSTFCFMHAVSRWDGVDYFHDPEIEAVLDALPEELAYEVSPEPRDGSNRYFNNISDSYDNFSNSSGFFSPLLTIIGKYHSGIGQWVFNNTVQNIPNMLPSSNVEWFKRGNAEAFFIAFLSYDGVAPIEPSTVLPKTRLFRDRGLLYVRTSSPWAGLDDIQFALEGHQVVAPTTGFYNATDHTHSDKNHFTLYAYGQDFIVDQGPSGNTNSAGEHNYILIDDRGQANNPVYVPPIGHISGHVSSGGLELINSTSVDFVHGDAKEAFNYLYVPGHLCSPVPPQQYCRKDESDPTYGPYINTVLKANRYVHFVKEISGLPPYIIIADDIQKDLNEREYRWRFHTEGSISNCYANPIVIDGNETPANKLFIYYYNYIPQTPSTSVECSSFQQTFSNDPLSIQPPPPSGWITRCDIRRVNVVNPYFHVMLFPHKSGTPAPSVVNSREASNGSILEIRWADYKDYSVFGHTGTVTADILSTDSKLAIVRQRNIDSEITAYSMAKGTQFTFDGNELVNLFGISGTVSKDGSTVEIIGNVNYFRVFAPAATTVKLNGNSVSFVQVGDYVEPPHVTINRTWSGNISSAYDITIDAGVTLRVSAGSTFSLSPGISIEVNGEFVANSTSQSPTTLTCTTGKWSGITNDLNASNISLNYTNISNASTALNIGSWMPLTVDHCTFSNCDIGINIYQGESVSNEAMQITNCTFNNFPLNSTGISINNHSNVLIDNNVLSGPAVKGTGVYLNASSPQVLHTLIEYWKFGFVCANGSTPMLEQDQIGGFNTIRNNINGVFCDGASDAILGYISMVGDEGGQNTICQNTLVDVHVDDSKVYAMNNSWTLDQDPPGIFEIGSSAALDYIPWLLPDPNCGGFNKILAGEGTKEGNEGGEAMTPLPLLARQALRERARGNYVQADVLLRSILANSTFDQSTKQWALGQLLAVGQRMRNPNLVSYLGTVASSQPTLARRVKRLLPMSHLREGSFAQAMDAYDANIRQYPNSSEARAGLYGKFTYQLYNRHDTTQARSLLNQLIGGYPESREAEISVLQMNSFRIASALNRAGGGFEKSTNTTALSGTKLPTEFALSQNYPNPFNPSTQIRFDLPEPSQVSLVVYDVLGRKLTELVSGLKEAGYHSVTWDGSSVASGVYFARFTATDANGKVKLSKVNKLLLTK